MSTLKADTIQSTGGGAATLTKQAAAKAHWLFEQANSNTLTVSLNVSAIANAFRGNGNILRAAGSLRWLCVYVSSTGGGGAPEDDDENSWQLIGDLA
jgi:hypothetical protein